MALGDRLDDRQPEARGAAAIPVGTEKPLEDLLPQLGRDARPVVLDREHDVAVLALHGRLDGGAGIGVPKGVLA